jgi:hypothetical protein
MNVKHEIEQALHAIGYHPDCATKAQEELRAAVDEFQSAGSPASGKNKLWSLACDATLMNGKYFAARLEFLSRLIPLLYDRPEQIVEVAEDGCGSGVDVHVVQTLLKDKVNLTGIDTNEAALARAKSRVPNARFMPDFDGHSFDVIYSDFVSIDTNKIWEVGARGQKTFNALRSHGVVLHNSDMQQLQVYLRFFGQSFSRIFSPELLAEIPEKPSCYLCKFEKA